MTWKILLLLICFNTAYAKLQPRIAIIGAGASGLTAAYELKKRGYKKVVVFEKAARVGGKVYSYLAPDGKKYELGAIWTTPEYRTILPLAKKFGVSLRPFNSTKYLVDAQGNLVHFSRYVRKQHNFWQRLKARTQLFLLYWQNPQILQAGHAQMPHQFNLVMSQLNQHYKLQAASQAARVFMIASGYGHYDEIPAAYILKALAGYWTINARDSLLFNSLQVFSHGFQKLWEQIARGLDVRLNLEVLRLERKDKVTIHTKRGLEIFDQVIISTPPSATLRFLDATQVEQQLFSRVQTIPYCVALFAADGLNKGQSYFFPGNMQASKKGRVLAFGNEPDGKYYLAYQYIRASQDYEQLDQFLAAEVSKLRGVYKKTLKRKCWNYFPHFSQADLLAGAYRKLEALQGTNSSYYIGSLMNFETTEHTARYAKELVARFFPKR